MTANETKVGDHVRAECGCWLRRSSFEVHKKQRHPDLVYFDIIKECDRKRIDPDLGRRSAECVMLQEEINKRIGYLSIAQLVEPCDPLCVALMERFQ